MSSEAANFLNFFSRLALQFSHSSPKWSDSSAVLDDHHASRNLKGHAADRLDLALWSGLRDRARPFTRCTGRPLGCWSDSGDDDDADDDEGTLWSLVPDSGDDGNTDKIVRVLLLLLRVPCGHGAMFSHPRGRAASECQCARSIGFYHRRVIIMETAANGRRGNSPWSLSACVSRIRALPALAVGTTRQKCIACVQSRTSREVGIPPTTTGLWTTHTRVQQTRNIPSHYIMCIPTRYKSNMIAYVNCVPAVAWQTWFRNGQLPVPNFERVPPTNHQHCYICSCILY